MVEKYFIQTGMGSIINNGRKQLYFLSEKQKDFLDEIGYSGKLNGVRTCRADYLNSLGIGEFDVTQTKSDNGDFHEEFLIIRFFDENKIKKQLTKPEILPESERDMISLENTLKNYVDFFLSDKYHEDDDIDWDTEIKDITLCCFYGSGIKEKLKEYKRSL